LIGSDEVCSHPHPEISRIRSVVITSLSVTFDAILGVDLSPELMDSWFAAGVPAGCRDANKGYCRQNCDE
jgi:hypothetical protein